MDVLFSNFHRLNLNENQFPSNSRNFTEIIIKKTELDSESITNEKPVSLGFYDYIKCILQHPVGAFKCYTLL